MTHYPVVTSNYLFGINMNDSTITGPDIPSFPTVETDDIEVVAWQEIAPGRFMPRRVRGSCKGRVLG
jgi:hypothetical protein